MSCALTSPRANASVLDQDQKASKGNINPSEKKKTFWMTGYSTVDHGEVSTPRRARRGPGFHQQCRQNQAIVTQQPHIREMPVSLTRPRGNIARVRANDFLCCCALAHQSHDKHTHIRSCAQPLHLLLPARQATLAL